MKDPPTNKEQLPELLTMKEAAAKLGIQYWKIQRAVKLGLVPTYSLFNPRKLVRVSEVLELMRNQH